MSIGRIRFDFSFFAMLAFILYNDKTGASAVSLLSCMLHECGHISFMRLYGIYPKRITFYAGGIRISGNIEKISAGKRLLVLSGGCMVNLFICLMSFLFMPYYYAELFFSVNLLLLLFNLLPIGSFDGEKIIEELLIKRFSYRKYIFLKKMINIFVSSAVMLFLLFYCIKKNGTVNISLAYTVLYMLLSEILIRHL